MNDEKFGHRIFDTALLNYLSQLQVSCIISSQIDKTLTTPRQFFKSSRIQQDEALDYSLILQEFLKNSAAICSSDKSPT